MKRYGAKQMDQDAQSSNDHKATIDTRECGKDQSDGAQDFDNTKLADE